MGASVVLVAAVLANAPGVPFSGLYTISGPFPKRDLIAIAESLTPGAP